MRKEALGTIVIALIAIAFVAGYEVSSSKTAKTITVTGGHSSSTSYTSGSNATTCYFTAWGTVNLKVLNSSNGQPLGSLPVHVEYFPPPCPPTPHTTQDQGIMDTNASGLISVGGLGEYYFSFPTFGDYSVNASIQPERVACVTLSLPSQELQVNYSATFSFKC